MFDWDAWRTNALEDFQPIAQDLLNCQYTKGKKPVGCGETIVMLLLNRTKF